MPDTASQLIGNGDVYNHTAAAAITVGDLVTQNEWTGIALESGVTGDLIPVNLKGVWNMSKSTGANFVFGVGTRVYLTSTGAITNVATSNTFWGLAMSVGAINATSVYVAINWGSAPDGS